MIPRDQIICTEFEDGDGILVDLRTRRYYQLNETALLVWKGLENRTTEDEIIGQICADFEVQPDRARRSVKDLITQLYSYRLLTTS